MLMSSLYQICCEKEFKLTLAENPPWMNISTPTEVHAWPSREEGYSPLEYSFTQVFWAEKERGGRIEGWKGGMEGRDGKEEMKKVGKERVKGKGVTEGQGEGREGWWKVRGG